MKRTTAILTLLMAAVILLTACGSSAATLSGRYTNSGLLTETVYEFHKEGTVTFKLITAGYVAVTLDGTYTINESKTEITLTFDTASTDFGSLMTTADLLNGTFTFSEGEGFIQIGTTQYTEYTE